MLHELRLALRTLLRAPRFSLVAVVTLALGVGATTAIFTVVNAALLAPLPYHDPGKRVMVWSRWTGYDKTWLSDAEVLDYRRLCHTLSAVGAWGTGEANLTGDGDPVHIGIGSVTPNAFEVLGAAPLLGRTFTPDEARPNGPHVAIISYSLWQQRFGGNPVVVGQPIDIDGVRQQIVGVMPRGFRLPTDFTEDSAMPTQVWLPLALDSSVRGSHSYYAAGVLAPGATAASATAELQAVTANFTKAGLYPKPMHFSALAVPLDTEIRGTVRPAILLVAGAVGFLLLIACANVANLMLVRADGRQRELAVRTALGAGPGRLLRQLLIESLLLSIVGAAAGLLFATSGLSLLLAINPDALPALGAVTIDGRVLAFTALVAVATTVLFGIAPAARALKVNLVDSLKEGGHQGTIGAARQRMRALLVVGEMAMAVVLVVGAVLMVRSLAALQQVDLGFNPDRVLTARLTLPEAGYETTEKTNALYRQFVGDVRALPGVRAAGLVRVLPLANSIGDWGLKVEGYTPPPGVITPADWQVVSDGAIEALGEKLIAGRTIQQSDTAGTQLVGVINETMAKKYWPGRSALGGRFHVGGSTPGFPWVTVVGVVADVHHNGVTGLIKAKTYVPVSQYTAITTQAAVGDTPASPGGVRRNFAIVVRTAGNPLTLAGPGARVAALHRSQRPALRNHDDGRCGEPGAGDAAAGGVPAGNVRAARAHLRGHRHLRRAGLSRQPARARDRHPDGHRRRRRTCGADGARPRPRAVDGRHRHRARRRRSADAADAGPALRRQPARSADVHRRAGAAGPRGGGGQLPPRPPRDPRGSDAGVESGVGKQPRSVRAGPHPRAELTPSADPRIAHVLALA